MCIILSVPTSLHRLNIKYYLTSLLSLLEWTNNKIVIFYATNSDSKVKAKLNLQIIIWVLQIWVLWMGSHLKIGKKMKESVSEYISNNSIYEELD